MKTALLASLLAVSLLAGCFGKEKADDDHHDHAHIEAMLAASATTVTVGDVVTFNMTATADDATNATVFSWVLQGYNMDDYSTGDNQTGNGTAAKPTYLIIEEGVGLPAAVNYTAPLAGNFSIQLVVSADEFEDGNASVELTVTAAEEEEPEPEPGMTFPQYLNGTVSGAVACTNGATSTAGTPDEQTIDSAFWGRVYSITISGTTTGGSQAEACIEWQDASGATLTAGAGSTVPEGATKAIVSADLAYEGNYSIKIE